MIATCPTCQQKIETATLAALRAHVRSCGKPTIATKRKTPPPEASVAALNLILPAVITLPREIPSQNVHHNRHWRKYSSEKHAWMQLVGAMMRALHHRRLPWSTWKVTRVMGPRGRLYDFGNLVGGAKPLIDAIRDHHVIHDDSPAYFHAEYEQVAGDSPHTILTLIEVADAPKDVRRVRRPEAGEGSSSGQPAGLQEP